MFETLKSKLPINWDLIGNPVNWIIVFLMIAVAGAGLAVVTSYSGLANQDDA